MSRSRDWNPSLWSETFEDLVDDGGELDYGDSWTLNFNYSQTEQVSKEERKKGWKVCTHYTIGNFRCANCRRTWPSGRVNVLFRYRLRGRRGNVIMRPFGQACRRCHDVFLLPGFSKEIMKAALRKLCSKIRKNCYNEDEGDTPRDMVKKWTKPHETDLCEACEAGICTQRDD
ncbi:receptor-transporting protein 3-like [Salarias fasciatus]|uniref:receptor-transporting protein 3-like n=1 Tax=Salarias fasciatus TaxID=181472 RepID=UPI001176664D|nr:receptor-transporting protein 3-like [Salarias fasciatus]